MGTGRGVRGLREPPPRILSDVRVGFSGQQGRCTVDADPKDGDHRSEPRVAYGTHVDLTTTPLGLTLKTDEFPRD
ncbi:hypothetical protein QF032_003560 [Streptomyces achromogenes]|uniref:hypothetical protein n=1 Tax=Streptomyces achromogenes TaxID=67255 RepID=UPI002789A03B|nr:hypothetical protein [Streptomyces achromogenes]MDQ0831716.1 hypothetical protein [Streptomyces achromogenes]